MSVGNPYDIHVSARIEGSATHVEISAPYPDNLLGVVSMRSKVKEFTHRSIIRNYLSIRDFNSVQDFNDRKVSLNISVLEKEVTEFIEDMYKEDGTLPSNDTFELTMEE